MCPCGVKVFSVVVSRNAIVRGKSGALYLVCTPGCLPLESAALLRTSPTRGKRGMDDVLESISRRAYFSTSCTMFYLVMAVASAMVLLWVRAVGARAGGRSCERLHLVVDFVWDSPLHSQP